jgi:hypothetical protein
MKLGHLRTLVKRGLISPSDLWKELKSYGRSALLSFDEIYSELLDSPELEEFRAMGLDIVSSPVQLKNRTLVIGYPTYRAKDQFAIGFYPADRRIKRLTPKGIYMGVNNRSYGSLDFRIKDFPRVFKDDLDFYRKAMRWSLDHLDFTEADYYSRSPYFPAKTRTKRGYLEELD